MKHRYMLFALFFQFSTPAIATNFYVGTNVGLMGHDGKFDVLDEELNPSLGITRAKEYKLPDGDELTYSLYAGYKLASDLFLEVGFASNNDVEGKVRQLPDAPPASGLPDRAAYEEYQTDYIYAAFVGFWPVHDNWALTARLGVSIWDMSYTQYSADIPPEGLPESEEIRDVDVSTLTNILVERYSDSSSAFFIGAGVSYAVDRNLEFKFSLEMHPVDFSFTNVDLDYDAMSLTLGAAYHF